MYTYILYVYIKVCLCVWVRLFLFHFQRESNAVLEGGGGGGGVRVVNVSCALYSHLLYHDYRHCNGNGNCIVAFTMLCISVSPSYSLLLSFSICIFASCCTTKLRTFL